MHKILLVLLCGSFNYFYRSFVLPRGQIIKLIIILLQGLRRPNNGYWPLLVSLLDQDTRSHLLLYSCPRARGVYLRLKYEKKFLL